MFFKFCILIFKIKLFACLYIESFIDILKENIILEISKIFLIHNTECPILIKIFKYCSKK